MCVRFEDFIRITHHWGVQSDGLSGLKSWYAYLHLAVHKRRPRADCDVRGTMAGAFHVWYPVRKDLVTRIWSLQIQWYSNEWWSELCQGISAHYRGTLDTRRLLYMSCSYHIFPDALVPTPARTWHEETRWLRRPMGGACHKPGPRPTGYLWARATLGLPSQKWLRLNITRTVQKTKFPEISHSF